MSHHKQPKRPNTCDLCKAEKLFYLQDFISPADTSRFWGGINAFKTWTGDFWSFLPKRDKPQAQWVEVDGGKVKINHIFNSWSRRGRKPFLFKSNAISTPHPTSQEHGRRYIPGTAVWAWYAVTQAAPASGGSDIKNCQPQKRHGLSSCTLSTWEMALSFKERERLMFGQLVLY